MALSCGHYTKDPIEDRLARLRSGKCPVCPNEDVRSAVTSNNLTYAFCTCCGENWVDDGDKILNYIIM